MKTDTTGLERLARRFRRASARPVRAERVNAEHARQMRAVAGLIPYDDGDTHDAMTQTSHRAREAVSSGRTVRIVISTPGAWWQRHRLPHLINTSAMAREAVATIYMEG